MKTQAEKTLDLIQAVIDGKVIERQNTYCDWDLSLFVGNSLIAAIIATPDRFRVKPELKVFKCSTRAYKSTAHALVSLWVSASGIPQERVEKVSWFKGWVGDTVEHTVEYEE